jgi:hypothetical protein
MEDFYQLRFHPIEIEKHPTFSTHYIQNIDIVDKRTGHTIETIQEFSTIDGIEAAKKARLKAREWIANRIGDAHDC